MASDMSELIDKLKLGKVNVVGWSDGGNIGLELAYAHPDKVLKVITFGANYSNMDFIAPPDSVTMDPDDPLIIQTSILTEKHKTEFERLSPDQERIPLIKRKLEALVEKYPNFTLDQIRTINVPFLVVAGDHDLIHIDHTVAFFKNLKKAQLFIIPGASHFGPAEYPELVNAEIIRFLKMPYRDIDNYYFLK
jgi:pimeloyl-ACP methyl ester carboxylesterase